VKRCVSLTFFVALPIQETGNNKKMMAPAFSHGISHTGKNTWQGQKVPVLDANFDPE
jgi:hypothetical protein